MVRSATSLLRYRTGDQYNGSFDEPRSTCLPARRAAAALLVDRPPPSTRRRRRRYHDDAAAWRLVFTPPIITTRTTVVGVRRARPQLITPFNGRSEVQQ